MTMSIYDPNIKIDLKKIGQESIYRGYRNGTIILIMFYL